MAINSFGAFSGSLQASQFQSVGGFQGGSLLNASFAGGISGPAQFGAPPNLLQLLQQVLVAFTSLASGWSSFGGLPQQYPQPQFPQFPQPGYPQPGYPQPGYPGPYQPGPVNPGPFNPGGFGSPNVPPTPSDPNEFASYLQAQLAGGSLQGKTGISQADAIPGSRFGRVQDSTQWQASVARNYAYQFAAYAVGANPLSPAGMAAGANAVPNMRPDAQIFMQVASVFKGNLFGGPGNYDNPGLRNLLVSTGNGDLVSGKAGVGETDVQTIGAITAALNRGSLTLNQVIGSGTIDNLGRYNTIINYVTSGGFANDLRRYDTVPV